MNLRQLAARTRQIAERAALAPEVAADRLAPVMILTAREVIGTHVLRDLMPSTQAERERLGYPANEPLLREGDFRDTIEGGAIGPTAFTGTDDPRGEWFEHGTPKMKPFANFALTLEAVTPKAIAIAEVAARETIE